MPVYKDRMVKQAGDLLRRLLGADAPVRTEQIACAKLTLGTEYGAHCVCPTSLSAESVVYSFGLGEDISFDLALIERFGLTVYGFDPTPRSIAWVKSQTLPEGFVLEEIGIAEYDGTASFHPPADPTHISHTLLDRRNGSGPALTVPVQRLRTIMDRLGHERLEVLKLDVEGAEYGVLEDVIASGIDAGQLLVEFHHQLKEVPLAKTTAAVALLNDAGYRIFNVSASGREYSFIKG